MAIGKLGRMTETVTAAVPTCIGIGHRKNGDVFSGHHSLHTHTASGTLLRVDYSEAPDGSTISAADAAIQGHDDTPNTDEKMEAVPVGQKAMLATVVKESSHWAGLTAGQKNQFQTRIDAAALKVLQALGIL